MKTTLLFENSYTDQEKNRTVGIELMSLGYLVLNKAQTVNTFGWSGIL